MSRNQDEKYIKSDKPTFKHFCWWNFRSKLSPFIFPIECSILHNKLCHALLRYFTVVEMNRFVFHSIAQKHQLGCLFHRKSQKLLNLVWGNVASQEHQIFIVCQLLSQMIKQFNQGLADLLLALVQEQNYVLLCAHF